MQSNKDTPLLDPLVGTTYQAIRLLGQGGMGQVFEAEHRGLGKKVVVKLLHASIAANPHCVDRLRVEAQTLASLSSPYLVSVSDIGATPDGRPFFVMEHLVGSTFRRILTERRAIPPGEAVHWMRQVLLGLAAAHKIGIVHRDVKLDNLFLCVPSGDRGPAVKVLDFGIAKVLSGIGARVTPRYETAEGMLVGSPRYMSPEQAKFLPVDARTDVYAAGLVLYTLLVGEGPFPEAKDMIDLLYAHAETAPHAPSRMAPQYIPPEVDRAVLKALAKKPEHRFQSAEEFAEELQRIAIVIASKATNAPSTTAAAAQEPGELAEASTIFLLKRKPDIKQAPEPSIDSEAPTPLLRRPPPLDYVIEGRGGGAPRTEPQGARLSEPAPMSRPLSSKEREIVLVLTLASALFFTVVIVFVLRAWGVV